MADQKVELQVILSAIDNATKEIKNVRNEIDKFSSAGKEAKKQNENMTASVFKGVAAWDLAKNSLRAVSSFMKTAVSEGKEAVRNQLQLNSVLSSTSYISGMTAAAVNEIAQELSSMTSIEDDAILTGQNMLLTFTRIGKDVFPQTTEAMLDMATAMNSGVTPSSEQLKTTAILLGKALNDPINGISSLQRNGVTFTATQKSMIENFIKMGDVVSAQKVILSEIGTEFGGMAKNLADPMEQAKNAVGELKEEIGKAFLPVVDQYSIKIKVAATQLTEFITSNKDSIIEVTKLVAVGISAIGVFYAMSKAVGVAQGMIILFSAANRTATAAMMLSTAKMVIMTGGLAAAAVAVAYLSNRFGGLNNAFAVIGAGMAALGQVIVMALKELGNATIGFLNKMLDKGNQAYNYLSGLLEKVGVDIGKADLKLDFQFDVEKSRQKFIALGDLVNQMEEDTKAAKQRESDNIQAQMEAQLRMQEEAARRGADLAANAASSYAEEASAKDKSKEKTEDLTKAMEDLGKEYQNLKQSGEESLVKLGKDHREKLASIRKEIDDTRKSMANLQSDYSRGLVSDNKSVAEQVISTEEKIADLKQQLSKETDAKKRAEIQATLTKEEEALKQSANFTAGIQAEIIEARRRSGLTDLQKSIEDYQTKRSLALQEYNAKMSDLQNELAALREKERIEVELFTAKVQQINVLMDQANIEYAKTMDVHLKKTVDVVNAEIEMFKKLAKAIADARAAESISIMNASVNISGARAAGGPVQFGEAYLVGEKGPEIFVPGATGNIVPNSGIGGGMSIQVNITGNNISNKMDLREISNKVGESIMGKLRLNSKLAI